MKYLITLRESVIRRYSTEADDPQDALKEVLKDTSQFDSEDWTTEKVEIRLNPRGMEK